MESRSSPMTETHLFKNVLLADSQFYIDCPKAALINLRKKVGVCTYTTHIAEVRHKLAYTKRIEA